MSDYQVWLNHVEDIVYCRVPTQRFIQKRSFFHPAIIGEYKFYPMPSGGVYMNLDEVSYIFHVGDVGITSMGYGSINWEVLGNLLTDLIPIEVARDMVRMYTL